MRLGCGAALDPCSLRAEGARQRQRAQVRAHDPVVVGPTEQKVGQDLQTRISVPEGTPWLLGLALGSAHHQGLSFLWLQKRFRPVLCPHNPLRDQREGLSPQSAWQGSRLGGK